MFTTQGYPPQLTTAPEVVFTAELSSVQPTPLLRHTPVSPERSHSAARAQSAFAVHWVWQTP
jgi:hypothetical protein